MNHTERVEFLRELARRGYVVLPLSKETGKPYTLYKDVEAQDEASVLHLIGAHDGPNWAARPPHGMVVVDLENKKGWDGIADLRMLLGDSFEEVWSRAAVTRTKTGGAHLYFNAGGFKYPTGYAKYGTDGIEFKYHAPCHLWLCEKYDKLSETGMPPTQFEAPELPKQLLDLWAKVGANKPGIKPYNEADKVPAGQHHAAIVSAAGRYRNAGMTQHELAQALKTFRDERFVDCYDEYDDDYMDTLAADYAQREASVDLFSTALQGDPVAVSVVMSAVRAAVRPREKMPANWEAAIAACPPRMSALLRWVDDWNPVSQPGLALASAIQIYSMLIGNQAEFKHSRANMFCCGMGGTSVGKKRPIDAVRNVLFALHPDCMGPSDLTSSVGMLEMMEEYEERVAFVDELPQKLSEWNDRGATGQSKQIQSLILQWFSGGFYKGSPTKGKPGIIIHEPYWGMMTMAQPTRFWEELPRSMIDDGFIGRITFFAANEESSNRPYFGDSGTTAAIPGTELMEHLRQIRQPGRQRIELKYDSTEARGLHIHYHTLWDEHRKKATEFDRACTGKYPELRNKLEMIYAVAEQGLSENTSVNVSAIKWADAVIQASYETLFSTRDKYWSPSQWSRWVKEVKALIKRGIPPHQIAVNCPETDSGSITKVLNMLTSSGEALWIPAIVEVDGKKTYDTKSGAWRLAKGFK